MNGIKIRKREEKRGKERKRKKKYKNEIIYYSMCGSLIHCY
jgi:hypothetical protein